MVGSENPMLAPYCETLARTASTPARVDPRQRCAR